MKFPLEHGVSEGSDKQADPHISHTAHNMTAQPPPPLTLFNIYFIRLLLCHVQDRNQKIRDIPRKEQVNR